MEKIYACGDLIGKTINGWQILERQKSTFFDSSFEGDSFSIWYKVKKDDTIALMKVLDYEKCHTAPIPNNITRTEYINNASSVFKYEMSLSDYCRGKHLSKVHYSIERGETELEGYIIKTVSYIVYEGISGNIMSVLNFSNKVSSTARLATLVDNLRALHSVSVGLKQLHTNQVAYQSLFPNNVVTSVEGTKIANLTKSICFNPDIECPYYVRFNGDWTYAPPEAYFVIQQETPRDTLFQMDNYMLGSLIVFYLTGVSLNSLVDTYLPSPLSVLAKQGYEFNMIVPDLILANEKALNLIKRSIPLNEIQDELISIIKYLTFPDPSRRGHPKVLSKNTSNYDLQRTITQLDKLSSKAKIALSK